MSQERLQSHHESLSVYARLGTTGVSHGQSKLEHAFVSSLGADVLHALHLPQKMMPLNNLVAMMYKNHVPTPISLRGALLATAAPFAGMEYGFWSGFADDLFVKDVHLEQHNIARRHAGGGSVQAEPS